MGTVCDFEIKKASQISANHLKSLVPEEGFEPSQVQGPGDFESLIGTWAISHYFQLLRYQALTRAMLDYVGLCWVILGFDGYKMVTFAP
jgi:hypothetical protein